jgi:hypothetical protein
MKLIVVLFLIVAVIGGLAALGLYAQRKLKQQAPESPSVRRMSALELAHASLGAVLLFAGIAAYELAPDSILGAFLHEPHGIPAAVIGAMLGLYILGIPIAVMRLKKKGHGV